MTCLITLTIVLMLKLCMKNRAAFETALDYFYSTDELCRYKEILYRLKVIATF